MPAIPIAGEFDAVLTSAPAALQNQPVATPGVTSAPLPVVGPAEVLHVTSTPLLLPAAVVLVDVIASVSVKAGAGTNALIVRLYRGTAAVAGNLLGTQAFPVTPTPVAAFAITAHTVDQQGPGGSVQYSATVQQAGAPGAGAVLSSSITAQILQ